jgi:hypothetical protein
VSHQANEFPNLVDRSVKLLFRDRPDALLRLAGLQGSAEPLRFEDTYLNFPELRADHVLLIHPQETPQPYALYIEYQLRPDATLLPHWCLKWGGLLKQLGIPVILYVVYLEQGDRATFPDEHRVDAAGLYTALSFSTLRLWEHRDRITSGELAELAPLLVLCEEEPTEQTLRLEAELIHGSGLPRGVQAGLAGLAMLLASRSFARGVLQTIFREDLAMVEQMETLRELFLEVGALEKWAEDSGITARIRAEGEAVGKAEGEAEGIARGKVETARQMTLAFLKRRFGELPQALVDRITSSDAEACQSLFDRAIAAVSLAELTDTP